MKTLASKVKSSKIALSSARGQHYFLLIVKIKKKIFENLFLRSPEKNFEDFFLKNKCACVVGLEHSCPWPRDGLSWERLYLASDFFCVLGLESCVLDSTPDK